MEFVTIEEKAFQTLLNRAQECQRKVDNFYHQMKPKKMDDWVDNEGACVLLQVHLRTLQSYRESGKLPYSRIENKIFYKIKDLYDFLTTRSSKENRMSRIIK